jgi:hypothetical protein
MSSNVGKEARQRAENYKKALKYLDTCGTLDYGKFSEINKIAGYPFTEEQIRQQIAQSDFMLPIGGKPGGMEALKQIIRETLVQGESTFGSLADKLGAPQAEKSNCFVATVAFGSPLAPEVEFLRSFRDETLLRYSAGRIFIKLYYKLGPSLAKGISFSQVSIKITRFILIYVCRILRKK